MAISTTTASTKRSLAADQRVAFLGVGWAGYRRLMRVQGEASRPQILYLDGDAYLVSPSYNHEFLKKRLGQIVVEVAFGLNLPCVMAGETTLRRRRKRGGVQPDESFYFANAATIAAKKGQSDIDLRFDPPPNLAIEVVHTHDAKIAVEVLRRLGVPEVWVCDGASLRVLRMDAQGSYLEQEASRTLPGLTSDEIHQWATRTEDLDDTAWLRAVRSWVETVLAPRVAGRGGPHV